MKKIVPFSKTLKLDSNILEVNSISLEHNFENMGDEVAGEFIISGDFIVDNEAREKNEFKYTLPFDIALGLNYNKDNMVVDIDDFRYQMISPNEIKIDIDLYIDGEIIPDIESDDTREYENIEEPTAIKLQDIKRDVDIDVDNLNINDNSNDNINPVLDNINNMFENINDNSGYITYRVYTVTEGDTIDSIIAKYNISIEDLKKYNDISNIKPLDKLIIPSDEK